MQQTHPYVDIWQTYKWYIFTNSITAHHFKIYLFIFRHLDLNPRFYACGAATETTLPALSQPVISSKPRYNYKKYLMPINIYTGFY